MVRSSPSTLPFQSAPLTEARGDPTEGVSVSMPPCFNPLPSPKQGETGAFLAAAGGLEHGFQSAPLTEARGDVCARP